MTTEQLLSLLSFGRPGYTLPVANSPPTIGDKQHLLGLYALTSTVTVRMIRLVDEAWSTTKIINESAVIA